MHFSAKHVNYPPQVEDTRLLRKQLEREINCLELQLERLNKNGIHIDNVTAQTYSEMITWRLAMLESL